MNESLEVIKRLWTEDEMEYEGKYYTVPKTKLVTRRCSSRIRPSGWPPTTTWRSAGPPGGATRG